MWACGVRRGRPRGLSGKHANAAFQPQLDAELNAEFIAQLVAEFITEFLAVELWFVWRVAEHSVVAELEWQQRKRIAVPAPAVDLEWRQ